jgi:hypothetical protein
MGDVDCLRPSIVWPKPIMFLLPVPYNTYYMLISLDYCINISTPPVLRELNEFKHCLPWGP